MRVNFIFQKVKKVSILLVKKGFGKFHIIWMYNESPVIFLSLDCFWKSSRIFSVPSDFLLRFELLFESFNLWSLYILN
ncbi:hypothetical protein RchiOBHm_Chr1g0369911 [Rosa chinensis]|uniref:Uncharacterized protein n=1 Tax=Rosa chinensis TaxID=74649 RepID=A0A2P6SL54_ROSCH|nr:hypothetical protein RchiOBHm_Chr1g0369911 [Rosa chinensis]